MEEYIEKAVTGFDGCNLLEGYYKNRSYFAELIDDKIWLYSNEPIASDSRFEDDMYERLTYKLVSRDEIESIRVEKKSVYKEFLEKYF